MKMLHFYINLSKFTEIIPKVRINKNPELVEIMGFLPDT